MTKNRSILPKIIKNLDNDLVLILIGARQVGKTFLLTNLLANYIREQYPGSLVLYFDLEKPDVLDSFANYQTVISYLTANGVKLDKKAFLMLDEFQKMPTPTKTLKIIHDHYPNIKIIATGSSSLDIYKKLRAETMAGRKKVFDVYGLEFQEFIDFSNETSKIELFHRIGENLSLSSATISDLMPLWNKFCVWGGYPKIALSGTDEEKKEMLAEIYQAYLERDITGLLNLEDTTLFIKLVNILATQAGGIFNVNEMSKMIGLSRFMAEKYLLLLEQTFIIKRIMPFYSNRQKELTKMPKLYFMDLGLRNWAVKNFSDLESRADNGALAESAVFLELYKNLPLGAEINFWRTPQGTEVDFVLKHNQQLVPIEVKYRLLEKSIVPSGLKAFIRRYQPQTAYVLSKNFYGRVQYEKCEVTFLPIFLVSRIPSSIKFS